MRYPDEELAPGDHLTPEERDLEAPPDDALEQAAVVDPVDHEVPLRRGLEVDDYDAFEQSRIVHLDDDDYR
ncbi:MAG TPA: hypothetical protein VIL44_08215 [Micromonospora sp.]